MLNYKILYLHKNNPADNRKFKSKKYETKYNDSKKYSNHCFIDIKLT